MRTLAGFEILGIIPLLVGLLGDSQIRLFGQDILEPPRFVRSRVCSIACTPFFRGLSALLAPFHHAKKRRTPSND